jgi:hypothetical protein
MAMRSIPKEVIEKLTGEKFKYLMSKNQHNSYS